MSFYLRLGDLLSEIQTSKNSQQFKEKATALGKEFKLLRRVEKSFAIQLVQDSLKKLFLPSITPPKEETVKKIELLRLLLFGADLKKIPAYRDFQMKVELANRQMEALVAVPKKALEGKKTEDMLKKAKSMGIQPFDLQGYQFWTLPQSYLFLGSADSLTGIKQFAEKLSTGNYHETLCLSAINEKTPFFKEAFKLFLICHVNPDTIVHSQERDIRSPRFSENVRNVRTEWYDFTRRNIALTAEIDSSFRIFVRHVLPDLFREKVAVTPISTLLDRFNRLSMQKDELKTFLYGALNPLDPSEAAQIRNIYESSKLLEKYGKLCNSCQGQILRLGITKSGDVNHLSLQEQKALILQILIQKLPRGKEAVERCHLLSFYQEQLKACLTAIQELQISRNHKQKERTLERLNHLLALWSQFQHDPPVLEQKEALKALQLALEKGKRVKDLIKAIPIKKMIKKVDPEKTLKPLEEALKKIPGAASDDIMEYLDLLKSEELKIPEADFRHLKDFLTEYNFVKAELSFELDRVNLLDLLERLPNKSKEVETAIQLLRGEKTAAEVGDLDTLFSHVDMIDPDSLHELLLHKSVAKHLDAKLLQQFTTPFNRSRLQILSLISLVKEREQQLLNRELREQVYRALFREDDPRKKYDVMAKLVELERQFAEFPKEFVGETKEAKGQPYSFLPSPERLLSPQEAVQQTSKMGSPWGYDWNEFNLDLEASGGGQKGGVYPLGIVIKRQNLIRILATNIQKCQLLFEYAKQHHLPVFVKE